MAERFAELRAMGIRTVMITGDNALTAQAIADEAGVDDFLAEATPEDKMAYIRKEQEGGRLVAMTGDGTNDAPALAAADVGVAMNSGTAAAKEAGNMVDLDSDPTKLIDIVEIGKQLLITRGALTTFSIANDVAKYFAIIPAMFVAAYPSLDSAQRDGPGHAAVRDPLGGDLQRADHRGPDPAGPARRAVPRRLGDLGAAPQHPRLRTRRHRRAVHRHQAHRPARLDHPRNRLTIMLTRLLRPLRQSLAALRLLLVLTVLLGVGYPVAVWARRPGLRRPRRRPARPPSTARSSAPGLIGQNFEGDEWFHSRPSANDYDTLASAPSNLGPLSTDLIASDRGAPGRRSPQREGVDRVGGARPTPSPPPAPASTRTSRRRTPSSRRPRRPRQRPRVDDGRAARSRSTPRAASWASSASPASTCSSSTSPSAERAGERPRVVETEPMDRGQAARLPRRRTRCRQDLRHARRGPPAASSGALTSSSATSRPTAGRTRPRQLGGPRGDAARDGRLPRHRPRGDGPRRDPRAQPRRGAGRRARPHQRARAAGHEKRWQDVEALLDAGIEVITTVNIQHLESLNDVTESITGVRQRETVPDHVVRAADQIELVDMSPQALRRRMAHGNIYAAEKVDAALSNYFREGNLTALRELALLWLADRVDEGLERYREQHDIDGTWATARAHRRRRSPAGPSRRP